MGPAACGADGHHPLAHGPLCLPKSTRSRQPRRPWLPHPGGDPAPGSQMRPAHSMEVLPSSSPSRRLRHCPRLLSQRWPQPPCALFSSVAPAPCSCTAHLAPTFLQKVALLPSSWWFLPGTGGGGGEPRTRTFTPTHVCGQQNTWSCSDRPQPGFINSSSAVYICGGGYKCLYIYGRLSWASLAGTWGWGLSPFQTATKVAAAIFSFLVSINPGHCSYHALRQN